MSIEPAVYADWAEDLACSIIAAYCGRGFTEARKEIAGKLRDLRKTCDDAALARIRIAARELSDAQWDADREREGAAQ